MRYHITFLSFFLLCSSVYGQGTLDVQVTKMIEDLAASVNRGSDRPLRVAVFPLTREDSDEVTKFGVYLQETISTQLVKARGFTPVNRRRLKKLLEELDFQSSDFVDEKTRSKIGEFAGADLVLLGSYWDLGDKVKINAGLYGLQSADTIAAGSCLVSRQSVPAVLLTVPVRKVKTKPAKTEKPKVVEKVEKKEKKVRVILTSKPAGAKVFWGDRMIGKTWRPLVHSCEEGKQSYRFILPGYEEAQLTINVEGLDLIKKCVDLKMPAGMLFWDVQPADARIAIDGKEVKSAPGAQLSLQPGKHTVVLSADGFSQYTEIVDIKSNETKTIKHKLERKPIKDNAGIEFAWIPPGKFMMGALKGEREARDNEFPRHQVTISKGFWMGKYEVTQYQYSKIMGKDPSHYKGRNRPVEKVSLADAQEFCRRLTMMEKKPYRLPTEAEWEYACRAGTTEPRYLPADQCAWTQENSRNRTRDVGRLKPNALGLYDMLGNVFEWTQDRYGPYPAYPQTDPTSSSSSHSFVGRGGCFAWDASWARSSSRYRRGPQNRKALIGFRVVREP